MRNLDIGFSNDMNYSPLNENIFDSNIWKKDSQDDKDESSIFTDKNDMAKKNINNKQKLKTKKSKNSSMNSNTNSNSNNSDNNNSSSGNNNNNNNNTNKQKNNNNTLFQKKLTLPVSSIPYSLKMKKELNKVNTNNTNNKNIKKPIGQKGNFQRLPSSNFKGKEHNTNLKEKAKDKNNNKERKIVNKNVIKEKVELKNKNQIREKNNKTKSKHKEIKIETGEGAITHLQTNNIKQKIKDDDKNFENEEEFENGEDNEILQINKVQSIDVKPNFINNNYFQSNNPYYSNSNNSNNNSNKSLTKQRCYTESDDSYNKSNLNDPPSGRSNNSNKTFLTTNSYQGNKSFSNYPYTGLFLFDNPLNINNNLNNNTFLYPRKNTALMGSFLSTGANSYSHSGQRFDTSNSNESGQSSHNFNVLQRQFSNNNLNNNYIMQINPIETYPHNNFNSNEFGYKQPFSLNTSFYYKNNKSNIFSNNNEPKEKQIINLENIARGIEKRTTVMIRNVPIKYTIKVLEKELEYFYGKFDCLYIPFDYENGGNKGYAFLNLINPYHVLLFYEVFQGKCWSYFESKKICELNFANFQGIHEIKKHAKNYKGSKQPTFYNNVNYATSNKNIEVPKKYLNLILEKNPNLKYYENKILNTIIISSFN